MTTPQFVAAIAGSVVVLIGYFISRRTTKDVEEGKLVLATTNSAVDSFDKLSKALEIRNEKIQQESDAKDLVIAAKDKEIARLKKELAANNRKKKGL